MHLYRSRTSPATACARVRLRVASGRLPDLTSPLIGTVNLPDRIERERYFAQLPYLELSALFAGPLKPSALARWVEIAPKGAIGLAAPSVLTHRNPPKTAKGWPADASSGDFRDSPPGRVAIAALREAVDALAARCVVFRSPPLFAPSAANRDQLKRFFDEVATADAIGCERVWLPDGLWEVRTALKVATELGVICALDPLVREPGMPPEIHYDLEADALYFRVEGLGRTGKLSSERLDDLVMLIEHYEDANVDLTIAFASPERWNDAKNLKKRISESESESDSEDDSPDDETD